MLKGNRNVHSPEGGYQPEAKKRKSLSDYEFIINENSRNLTSELGKGSYGSVKKVKDKETGEVFAIKIMSKKSIFEFATKENLKREISIQRSINHPNIIKLVNYFEDKENVYLVLEFAENGSLFHYLRRKRKLSEEEAFICFLQTCLGIDYLHKRKILHRDLKPENLLLDGGSNIKLCDFGWSAESHTKRQTFCGTVDYMAPEMVNNRPYDHTLDIWCLGILLFEMLHGFAPYKGRNDQEKCSNIARGSAIVFAPEISNEATDLIKKILKHKPNDRITMKEIFEHPWMRKFESKYQIHIADYVRQQDELIRTLREPKQKDSINSNEGPRDGSYGVGSQSTIDGQRSQVNSQAGSTNDFTKREYVSDYSYGNYSNSSNYETYKKSSAYTSNDILLSSGSSKNIQDPNDRDVEAFLNKSHPLQKKYSRPLDDIAKPYGYSNNGYSRSNSSEQKSSYQEWKKPNNKYEKETIYEENDYYSSKNEKMKRSRRRSAGDEDVGFWERILIRLGCISRDKYSK